MSSVDMSSSRHVEPNVPLRFSLDDLYEFLGMAAMDVLDRFQRVEVEIREDGYSVSQREGGAVDLVEVDVRSLRRLFGQRALELVAFAERLQLLVPVRDGWTFRTPAPPGSLRRSSRH